jgi:hypothetical protein
MVLCAIACGSASGLSRSTSRALFASYAFPDMHRELHAFYVIGDTAVVELALQGTHKGPLELPIGIIQPTGKKMTPRAVMCFSWPSAKSNPVTATLRHGGPDAAGSVGTTQGCAVKVLSTSVPICTRDIEVHKGYDGRLAGQFQD